MTVIRRLISRLVIAGMLGAMWLLRRFDRYVVGSTQLRSPQAFREDPYPSFEYIRSKGNIVRSHSNRGWLLVGYDEVQSVLRSPKVSSDLRRNKFFLWLLDAATGENPVPFIDNPPMLNQDPPNHTRLRKLASAGFTSRYIQSLEPRIESFVNQLLDKIGSHGQFDVIASLAEPLPAMVIAEMMGVPDSDRHRFIPWSHDLTGATIIDRPDLIERAAIAEQEMRVFLQHLIEEKRHSPGDDFISRLVVAEADNDQLTRDEVISTCILLLSAGHETTTRLIGNGLYLLITHPEQFSKLRENLSLLPNAIEEMLRFEPPVQMTLRFVAEDHEFEGKKLKRGQMLMTNLAAANRDPKLFARPNEFDIERRDIRHVSFGYGIHLCLGLSLARLEARIAFKGLLDRFDAFALVQQEPTWQGNPFFRGLDQLNVEHIHRERH
jgi:cytochrome P450